MVKEEIVQDSDNAVTEWTKVVSTIQPPEQNAVKSRKGNPDNRTTPPPQLPKIKPNITMDFPLPKIDLSTMKYPVPPPPPFPGYRPHDLWEQPCIRTVDFLSQMEARSSIPIPVPRESPAALAAWASSLRLGDGERKPVDLKLKLG